MNDVVITKTIFLKSDANTVWSYLTDKDKLGHWFHRAENDLVAGQPYALVDDADNGEVVRRCWGKVLEAQPPNKLVYSFTVAPLNGAMTTVTWELQEAHGGTFLTLHHAGIGEAAGESAQMLFGALDAGWDEHFARLRTAS